MKLIFPILGIVVIAILITSRAKADTNSNTYKYATISNDCWHDGSPALRLSIGTIEGDCKITSSTLEILILARNLKQGQNTVYGKISYTIQNKIVEVDFKGTRCRSEVSCE